MLVVEEETEVVVDDTLVRLVVVLVSLFVVEDTEVVVEVKLVVVLV